MDWLQNRTTQFIALAGIIGTLAGFGYTGATYVNRIEQESFSWVVNEIYNIIVVVIKFKS